MSKIEALAKHMDCEMDDIKGGRNDDEPFDGPGGEFLVLTDDEADDAVRQQILDSVWAFNPEFLIAHMKGIDTDTIKALQKKCEDANGPLTKWIDDVDHFVDDAVNSDGRGHFLSGYDGEEVEVRIGKETYYLYRTN